MHRRTTLLLVALAGVTVAAASLSCSLLLNTSELEGHPCTDTGRCLLGYQCVNGTCVKGGVQVKRCDPACSSSQKCDLRSGTCTDVCAASVCPTGQACTKGSDCAEVTSGLGAPCTADADCAGAIPGCSTDPSNPGRVSCVCLTPSTGGKGVCLGLPTKADDCAACGDAQCLKGRFSTAGTVDVCAPEGFRTCGSPVDCADPDHAADCVLFAWGADPGAYLPGQQPRATRQLGFLAACATPAKNAPLPPGAACDPGNPGACETGLCLPAAGGAFVCTQACNGDPACAGVADGRCVDAPLTLGAGAANLFDVAAVCGSAPTLGAPCDDGSGGPDRCGTDAPTCAPATSGGAPICTRSCLDNADCGSGQGFSCQPATNACF